MIHHYYSTIYYIKNLKTFLSFNSELKLKHQTIPFEEQNEQGFIHLFYYPNNYRITYCCFNSFSNPTK